MRYSLWPGVLAHPPTRETRKLMTSETVHHAANIIPYRMVLPENFVCPDPESRADGMLQARPITESDYILSNHFSHRSDMIVDTGGFVFYQPDDFNVRVRPDVYVAFGVDEGAIRRRNGYVVWEAGKPPDLALEVASETTHAVDTRTKPLIYSSMGITEYWRFDPTGGEWYGYALAGDIGLRGLPAHTAHHRTRRDGLGLQPSTGPRPVRVVPGMEGSAAVLRPQEWPVPTELRRGTGGPPGNANGSC